MVKRIATFLVALVGLYVTQAQVPSGPPVVTSSQGSVVGNLHSECDGVVAVADGFGTIQSPNYPDNYDSDSTCETVIQANEGHSVDLYINDLDLETPHNQSNSICKYDFIKLYDGSDDTTPEIATICRLDSYDEESRHFRSSGRLMLIKFVSDGSREKRGYQLYYREEPSVCGELDSYDDNSGWLRSPREAYARHYLPNLKCGWPIVVEEGMKVKIDFYEYEMEKCEFDFLELTNGLTRQEGQQNTKICEDDLPEPFESSGHQVHAYLQTDESVQLRGFRARYSAVMDEDSVNCGEPVDWNEGFITFPGENPYSPNRNCVWNITVEPGTHIRFSVTQVDVEPNEACSNFLEVRDGGYLDSSRLLKLCEPTINYQEMSTTSNQLFIRFKTGSDPFEQSFLLEFHSEPGCGAVLTSESGLIQSPNYPSSITSPHNCTWTFNLPHHLTSLTLELFDLDIGTQGRVQNYDCRYVCAEGAYLLTGYSYFDGRYTYSRQYCGQGAQDTYLTTGTPETTFIGFVSTNHTVGRGFQVKYKAECHDNYLHQRTGNLSSPNFPESYGHAMNCSWILMPSYYGNFVVAHLHVANLNLDCDTQSLRVSDERGIERATFCGSGVEQTDYTFLLSRMIINYNAGPSEHGEGFNITWDFKRCSHYLPGRSGEIVSPSYLVDVPQGFTCSWYFNEDGGQDILTIRFDSFSWTSCEDSPLRVVNSLPYGGNSTYTPICSGQTTVQLSRGNTHIELVQNSSQPTDVSFAGSYEYSCGGSITVDHYGISFVSPGFRNGSYDSPQTCTWTLTPSQPGYFVQFHLHQLGIGDNSEDCSSGSLTINTFSDDGGMYVMCGTRRPVELTYGITAPQMEVTFTVQNGSQGIGFYGYLSTVSQPPCRHVYTEPFGSISSAEYVNSSSSYIDCFWLISAPFGSRIILNFTSIYTREADEFYCWNTELSVSGHNEDLCYYELTAPLVIRSQTNEVYVSFYSYSYMSPNNKSFSAEYYIEEGCGHSLEGPSGHLELLDPSPEDDSCEWQIQVSPGKGIRFDLQHYIDHNYAEAGFNCHYPVNLQVSTSSSFYGFSLDDWCLEGAPFPETVLWNSDKVYVRLNNIQPGISALSAFYQEIGSSELCGTTLGGRAGVFFSPGNAATDCPGQTSLDWVINVDQTSGPSSVVRLDVHHFYWDYVGYSSSSSTSSPFRREKRQAEWECSSRGIQIKDGNDMMLFESCDSYMRGSMEFLSSTPVLTLSMTSRYYVPDFIIQYSSVCFHNVTTFDDLIESGIYTDSYDCGWLIETAYPNKVGITFEEFDLETGEGPCEPNSTRDRIELYASWNVYSGFSELLATICQETSLLDLYASYSNQLYIRLVSTPSSLGGNGFKAQPSTVCLNNLAAYSYSRYLTAPYGMNDGPCSWNITADEGQSVRLGISTINLPSDCERNYLRITDGNMVTTYCSGDNATDFQSQGRSVLLTYQSLDNVNNSYSGFALNYFAVRYVPNCGGNLTTNNGHIISPFHPNNYANNLRCTWYIQAPAGHTIQLNFTAFDLETAYGCPFDFVQLFHGQSISSSSAASSKLCTSSLPSKYIYTSQGNSMTVFFKTDGSVVDSGFNASYSFYLGVAPTQATPSTPPRNQTTTRDPTTTWNPTTPRNATSPRNPTPRTTPTGAPCGGNITSSNGTVTSPAHPTDYAHNLNCVWTIEAPEGFGIQVNFTDFHLESASSCQFDHVQVFDGDSILSTPLSSMMCYSNLRSSLVFYSSSNRITIYFETDGSVSDDGFRATFQQFEGPAPTVVFPATLELGTACGDMLEGDEGHFHSPNYPQSYDNEDQCYWYISTSPGSTIQLTFTDFYLESSNGCRYDEVKVFDGFAASSSTQLGVDLCTRGLPSPSSYYSTGHRMMVYFKSDVSITYSGFNATFAAFTALSEPEPSSPQPESEPETTSWPDLPSEVEPEPV